MPGRVKAGHHGRAQLIAGHQHGPGAQRLQVAHDRHVVVGLHGVADDAVQPAQRRLVCCIVGADARLAVQVEGALLDLTVGKFSLRVVKPKNTSVALLISTTIEVLARYVET